MNLFILPGVRPSVFRGAFLLPKHNNKGGHNSLLLIITPPKNLNYSLIKVTLTLAVSACLVALRALLYKVKRTSSPLK